jgi:MFS transporter, DHA2 family, multidrug resistance protein
MIAAGWCALAIGLYYSAYRTDLLISFRFAMWLRVAQVIGIGFLFVPITMAGYIGIPAEKGNSVSGMVNFMRNIGSSIGTSIVTTMLARRAQYHQQILVGHLTPDTPTFRNALNTLSRAIAHSGLNWHDARLQALARFYEQVNRQAHTLAYLDTFWVLAVLSAIMFILAFFLKKNDPGAAGQIAAG